MANTSGTNTKRLTETKLYITQFAFLFLKAMASSLSMTLGLLFLCMLTGVHGGKLRVWGLNARGLKGDPVNPPDVYVKVWWGSKSGGMTDFVKDNANPSWGSEFIIEGLTTSDSLKLEVWDKDLNFDDHLGTCIFSVGHGTHNQNCRIGSGGSLFVTYSYSQ
ncbi:hypothetical protein DPEC_G00013910 [Dallia pectoralis]|uniref:Uncharacterized protein n=1 Tax=Dallia pectoralis TaxID=75939 RepID=A0ACC2HN21_DALPE|nr:hypothetical protein DPEC_G00013910 [Dallia pectoralis]